MILLLFLSEMSLVKCSNAHLIFVNRVHTGVRKKSYGVIAQEECMLCTAHHCEESDADGERRRKEKEDVDMKCSGGTRAMIS